ncbi:hypothetical protein C1631_018920 [Chryseobacterium phosphatilyticum]|uniref:Uncharacterized protein n=2 Tax=Chryseobacterium phosphatilyticum TaxID=475075 RepID=A0A316X228_9FLAO|nr:hypothetical protein C1631_018920 [Chryseobacterium phosphatilyticum]
MIGFTGNYRNAQILNFKEMIQFILMLLGLAFPNNNANTTENDNNPPLVTVTSPTIPTDPGDTSGENGQTPPRK